jgi:hypothetical protein
METLSLNHPKPKGTSTGRTAEDWGPDEVSN